MYSADLKAGIYLSGAVNLSRYLLAHTKPHTYIFGAFRCIHSWKTLKLLRIVI